MNGFIERKTEGSQTYKNVYIVRYKKIIKPVISVVTKNGDTTEPYMKV